MRDLLFVANLCSFAQFPKSATFHNLAICAGTEAWRRPCVPSFLELKCNGKSGLSCLASSAGSSSGFWLSVNDLLISQGFSWAEIDESSGLRIQNQPALDPNALVLVQNGMNFTVCGEPYEFAETVYIALHKPAGYECSRQPQSGPSVLELLPAHFSARGVQPAGRLDVGTSGLLLLSDDARFLHHTTHPSADGPALLKHYCARCAAPVTDAQLAALAAGVRLAPLPGAPPEERVRRCSEVRRDGSRGLCLAISEGAFHQVKRMVAAAGNRVVALHRHRVGGLRLDPAALPAGRWRRLDPAELGPLFGYDSSAALGVRRYTAHNRTMGAVRRRYAAAPAAAPVPPPAAGGGGGGSGARATVVAFVEEYLAAHGGAATVPVLGNELGRRNIKYPGRLAALLADHARAAGRRAAFAVGPGQKVTLLRPGRPNGDANCGGGGDGGGGGCSDAHS